MPAVSDRAPSSVLLIGTSRGLGAAMAGEMANRGWRVVGTVRGKARTPLHDIEDKHAGSIAIEALDIVRPEQISELRDRLAHERFDVLFVNAGIANGDPAATMSEITPEEFNKVMLTNAFGVMQVVEGLHHLVKPDGQIGAMSSGQGSIANNADGRNDLYRSSKAALNQLTKSYAARHTSDGRSLVLLAPGWIRTELGGPSAPFTVEESIPKVVSVLLALRGKSGLHYVDRDGATIPW